MDGWPPLIAAMAVSEPYVDNTPHQNRANGRSARPCRVHHETAGEEHLSQVRALVGTHKTWATGKRLVIVGDYPI
jgi:hypothetical protein